MTLCPLGSTNVFSNNNLKPDKRLLGCVGRDSEKILHFTGFSTNWKIRSSIWKCQCTQSDTIPLFLIPNSLKEETHLLKKPLCLLCWPHLQSMARPLGQPSVVFTIGKAWDPSLQALMIFAGRNQSVQNIYLKRHMSEDTQTQWYTIIKQSKCLNSINILLCTTYSHTLQKYNFMLTLFLSSIGSDTNNIFTFNII